MSVLSSQERSNISSEIQQWHPKLTPYRAFVLLSTIGLGGGKAIATAQGLSFAATAIEWVASVVFFVLIYLLGLLERNPPSNRLLSWFLTHHILQHQNGMDEYRFEDHSGPIITGYRLLTTFSVTLFGVIKAYLTYRGHSPAANAVDWISGVVITSCLYVLGLYEDNPVNLMPYLFFTDCTPLLYAGSWIIIYLTGISLSFFWIRISFGMTITPLSDLHTIYDNEPTFNYYVGIRPLFFLLCSIAGFFTFFIILRALLRFIHGFTFISSMLTRFHFDTWLRNIYLGRMSSFIFKSFKCLTALAACTILLAIPSILSLNLLLNIRSPGPISFSTLLWYTTMFPFLGFFAVFAISAFIGCIVCLYHLVCLLFIVCYSLAVQEIPSIFDSHRTGFWSHLDFSFIN